MSAKVDREKRTHCLGCSGWFSNGVHDEGYECPGYSNPPADPLAGLTVERLARAVMVTEHPNLPLDKMWADEFYRIEATDKAVAILAALASSEGQER